MDFHTVGGGYDRRREKPHIVRTAQGGIGQTVVTRREYLQDARFGVVLEGEGELLEELASALEDPRWGIWLGRKCCVPASPVLQGLFETAEEAEARFCDLESARRGEARIVHRYDEASDFEEGSDTVMDWPLDYGSKRWAPRRVIDRTGE